MGWPVGKPRNDYAAGLRTNMFAETVAALHELKSRFLRERYPHRYDELINKPFEGQMADEYLEWEQQQS